MRWEDANHAGKGLCTQALYEKKLAPNSLS